MPAMAKSLSASKRRSNASGASDCRAVPRLGERRMVSVSDKVNQQCFCAAEFFPDLSMASLCVCRRALHRISGFGLFLFFATLAIAQPAADASPGASAAAETVEVDWWAQMQAGGITMVFLGLLSVALIAFSVERALMIRRKRLCPAGVTEKAIPLIQRGDGDGLRNLLRAHPSTLARVIESIFRHRHTEYGKMSAVAENIGARAIMDEEEKTFPLSVIAALAPLLGLLGTMIGMIEAFQLVSIYGDEGGASMLAGSIAKALITTATGLVLAIPAIALFHYFKHRLHQIAVRLDQELETLLTSCFFEEKQEHERAASAGEPVEA